MKNLYKIFTAIVFIGLISISVSAQKLSGDWKLVEAVKEGEKVVFQDEIKTTVSFGEESKMFGNAGCNRYTTEYALKDEQKIDFQPIISTKMACIGEAMKQENTFFNLIEKIEKYEITDDCLIFFDESKQNVLKFAPIKKQDRK